MLDYKIGERVSFQADLRRVEGVLVRYNKKSVTVIADDGGRWTVSPGLLQRSGVSDSTDGTSTVIEMSKFTRSGS